MRLVRHLLAVVAAIAGVLAAPALMGCGGSGSPTMAPITVSLSSTTVVVSKDGTPTHIQILIKSTSETALVSFAGLPGGIQTMYAASDTNPSGLLTFIANTQAPTGTYMPSVTVNSAGQTASLTFTLKVTP